MNTYISGASFGMLQCVNLYNLLWTRNKTKRLNKKSIFFFQHDEISAEIQGKVNENFQEGKSQVRLNTDGITYFVLGDIETTGMTGEKKAYKNTLTLTEAIAMNGGLNRTIDRKNIVIYRKLPEGIKKAKIDLTREDVMNSPYFYVQNGDEILLTTNRRSLNGFGKDPLQTIISGVSVITTALSIYLLIKNL